MPEALWEQDNWSAGRLASSGQSIPSITQAQQGLARAENVSITPLGKIRVRSGLREITDLESVPTASNRLDFTISKDSNNNVYAIVGNPGTNRYNIDNGQIQRISLFFSYNYFILGDFIIWWETQTSHGANKAGLRRASFAIPQGAKVNDFDTSPLLTYRQIIRYTQMVNNVQTDFTYETTDAPWDDAVVDVVEVYNDRMFFAVGSTIYASDLGQYLKDSTQTQICFTRPAEIGEVVMHEGEELTITANDIGDSIATDSLKTTLTGRQNVNIHDLQVNEGLYAFTANGAFYTPDQQLEPGKFVMSAVTDSSIKTSVRAVEVQQSYVYVRASTGAPEAIIDLQQQQTADTYGFTESDISVFISGLIKNIKRLAVSKGTDKDTQEVLYALETDGLTCHCLHINREQRIYAWTQYKFDTPMLDIATFENRTFFIDSTKLYELNGDNKDVEWVVETLRPSIRQQGNTLLNLNAVGWRIVRAYLEARNVETPLFVNDKELPLRRFDVRDGVKEGIYDISIQGQNSMTSQSANGIPKGVVFSGTGGKDLTIDRISLKVHW